MNFEVKRKGFEITPKCALDEAFIEEVLKLTKDGDKCLLVRKNAMGLSSIAYLETKVEEKLNLAEAWRPKNLEEAIANSSTVNLDAKFLAKIVPRLKQHMLDGNSLNTEDDQARLAKRLRAALDKESWLEVAVLSLMIDDLE